MKKFKLLSLLVDLNWSCRSFRLVPFMGLNQACPSYSAPGSWREVDLETFHFGHKSSQTLICHCGLQYMYVSRGGRGGGPPRTLCFSIIGVSCHIWCARPHRQNRYVTERWGERRRRVKESLFPELRFDSRGFRRAQPRISAALAAGGKGGWGWC